MVTLTELATGKTLRVHDVDARDLIKSGLYQRKQMEPVPAFVPQTVSDLQPKAPQQTGAFSPPAPKAKRRR